jgi:hypothetical protein
MLPNGLSATGCLKSHNGSPCHIFIKLKKIVHFMIGYNKSTGFQPATPVETRISGVYEQIVLRIVILFGGYSGIKI